MAGFRYTDAHGVDHLVETMDEVPPGLTKAARPVGGELARTPAAAELPGASVAPVHDAEWALGVHLPSAAGGAALVVMLGGLWLLKRAGHGKAVRVVLLVTAVVGLFIGYVSWARRSTGLAEARHDMPTPAAVVLDAQNAAKALEKRMKEEEKTLHEIERAEGH